MTTPRLTIACVPTDRSRPIASGEVAVQGFDIEMRFGEPEDIFREALREQTHPISEMSMASHIATTARGDSAYIGVPVFLSRAFRHSAIYVRADAGIETLADLRGRRIGLPEYQQTAAMWVRGMMRDEAGVAASDVTWHVGGLNAPGPGERIKLDLPADITVHSLEGGATLDAMLRDGHLDAIISPRPPDSFARGAPHVRRLFSDLRAAEVAYFRDSGFFPIMHCLAVRRDVARAHPELAPTLFRAFAEAKRLRLAELGLSNVLRVSLPWIAHEFDATMTLTGGDPWPYGFERNAAELEAMTRYAHADGIAVRKVAPEELFHPDTVALTA